MAKILIVDDNKKNLQVLGNILHEKKHKVAMAVDGNSALKLADKILPELIILDIMMPGMDGFEVCEILKKQDTTKQIPVIFLTAKVDIEDIIKGFKLGGADYITKPFKKEELLARVNTQLEIINGKTEILKQKDQLEELNTFNNEFFSVISDDIKQAVNHFIEVPKLLKRHNLKQTNNEVEDILNEMEEKAKSIYELIETVNIWANIQQEKLSPKIGRVVLENAYNAISNEILAYANRKQININVQLKKEDIVISDPNFMQTIIKLLLHNAIKYSGRNTEVRIAYKEEANSSWLIVQDFGVGMDNETVSKIQHETSYHSTFGTNHEKGSGLSLKVIRKLIMLCNGELIIQSNLNEGTSVEVGFPNQN